jgi:hypothetical protein
MHAGGVRPTWPFSGIASFLISFYNCLPLQSSYSFVV